MWFSRVPQSNFNANRSRDSRVLFRHTYKQAHRDLNFIHIDTHSHFWGIFEKFFFSFPLNCVWIWSCHHVIMPSCDYVIMWSCDHVDHFIMGLCHHGDHVIVRWCDHMIMSSYHHVIIWLCHHVRRESVISVTWEEGL